MTFFADLGPDTQSISAPWVRAVGWLDAANEFPRGNLPPEFVERLRELCAEASDSALGLPVAAGLHQCQFCKAFRSNGVVAVPADDLLFIAPRMIGHYVECHSYLPPESFVDAVLASLSPESAGYAAAIAEFRSRGGG